MEKTIKYLETSIKYVKGYMLKNWEKLTNEEINLMRHQIRETLNLIEIIKETERR